MADDNPDALMTLALVLRDEGYVVQTCANPNIALEAIRRERPDVCMLDVKMPGRADTTWPERYWPLDWCRSRF